MAFSSVKANANIVRPFGRDQKRIVRVSQHRDGADKTALVKVKSMDLRSHLNTILMGFTERDDINLFSTLQISQSLSLSEIL